MAILRLSVTAMSRWEVWEVHGGRIQRCVQPRQAGLVSEAAKEKADKIKPQNQPNEERTKWMAVFSYTQMYIQIYIERESSGQKLYVKFNAMRKLGSSPIGCEDFSVPGGITNGVSV